jgi:outer membrane protein OmpA-like peptidoglycan-associated protein
MAWQSIVASGCLALGIADIMYIGTAAPGAFVDPAPDSVSGPVSVSVSVSEPEPEPEPEAEPEAGPAPEPVTVRFAHDSASLTTAARVALDGLSLEARLVIDGHADEEGSAQHNLVLSRRRAERVADYLEQRGVDRERMDIHAYGESRPQGDPRRDRRVEIHPQEEPR